LLNTRPVIKHIVAIKIPENGISNQYFLAKIKYEIPTIEGNTENLRLFIISCICEIANGK